LLARRAEYFAGAAMKNINMMNSSISPTLVDAYLHAEYQVQTTPAFVLKIGCYSPELKALYDASHENSAAFITAFNPASQALTLAENVSRNQALEQLIAALHCDYVHGTGKCADDAGIGELSFLVLGIDQDTATVLGQKFGQNAIVWCASNALPQLLLLK
jgi:hypothetical protein